MYPPLLKAARRGHIDCVIPLLKARANINFKNEVCLGLAGLRFDDSAGNDSANNANDMSSITTIQYGNDAIALARHFKNRCWRDVVSTIKQVFMFCNLRREC